MNESVQNILEALYTDSPVIRMYVDAIISGKGIPYTILMRSDESEKNREIIDLVRYNMELIRKVKSEMRDEEMKIILDYTESLLDEEFTLLPEEGKSYEVMMFNGDEIVPGSKQVVTDMNRIKMLREFAISKGFEFSMTEIINQ